jgi:hypothetical protein
MSPPELAYSSVIATIGARCLGRVGRRLLVSGHVPAGDAPGELLGHQLRSVAALRVSQIHDQAVLPELGVQVPVELRPARRIHARDFQIAEPPKHPDLPGPLVDHALAVAYRNVARRPVVEPARRSAQRPGERPGLHAGMLAGPAEHQHLVVTDQPRTVANRSPQ